MNAGTRRPFCRVTILPAFIGGFYQIAVGDKWLEEWSGAPC